MNIIIKTKNIELTPSLEAFINKKIGGLKKFIKAFDSHALPVPGERDLFETFVEVEKESTHHKKGQFFAAEARIYLPGRSLFAKAKSDDLMKAIIEARNELEREIRKYKTKLVELPRRKVMRQTK
ncbi:MAG: ribosome-associated translation inhibitor RaiA [Patescibacteria group bacterium]